VRGHYSADLGAERRHQLRGDDREWKTEYWGNSYGYDAWGNLTAKTITKCGAENLSISALANNQLSAAGYAVACPEVEAEGTPPAT
jgi:hypothetical protein